MLSPRLGSPPSLLPWWNLLNLLSSLICKPTPLPLSAQAKEQAKTNLHLSRSLTDLVETPFAKWTADHSARLTDSRRVVLDGWVDAWEKQREDARKLKVLRGEKARAAEVAEAE